MHFRIIKFVMIHHLASASKMLDVKISLRAVFAGDFVSSQFNEKMPSYVNQIHNLSTTTNSYVIIRHVLADVSIAVL